MSYGQPEKKKVSREDTSDFARAPRYLVYPVLPRKACEDLTPDDANIMLADFGESWKPIRNTRYELCAPFFYRPPEAMFAKTEQRAINEAADIWMLGCTIYAIFSSGDDLFGGDCADEDATLANNISALGKPPLTWWKMWKGRDEFFDVHGNWNANHPRISYDGFYSLEKRVSYIRQYRGDDFSDEEMADLLAMLESMLKWQPRERISAAKLLNGKWMKKWGAGAD